MGRGTSGLRCSAIALVVLTSGCPAYVPALDQVASPCQQASDCITGWNCVHGICVNGATGPVDAASRDAIHGDAGSDGAPVDRAATDGAFVDAAIADGSGRDQSGRDSAPRDRAGSDLVATDLAGRDREGLDLGPPDTALPDQWQPDQAQPDTWVDLPPPVLAGLSAVTSHDRGAIDVSVDFPDDVSDYAKVYILRVAGATPPAESCLEGVLAASFTIGHFVDVSFIDRGLTELTIYSYRACAYDVLEQVTGGPTATAITMGCWYEPMTESQYGLPADIIDAWAGQWSVDNTDPPRRIFSGVSFASGDRITLSGVSGRSDCRFEPNGTLTCVVDCPTGWKLFFKDGSDNVLWQSAPEDLGNYVGGVDVPAGAVSAWIGYRDGNCTTGSDCSGIGDPYMDNCDNRTASNGNCDKCNYDFTYGVFTCNAP